MEAIIIGVQRPVERRPSKGHQSSTFDHHSFVVDRLELLGDFDGENFPFVVCSEVCLICAADWGRSLSIQETVQLCPHCFMVQLLGIVAVQSEA
jgi:hypothetical protein